MKKLIKILVLSMVAIMVHCASEQAPEAKSVDASSGASDQTIATCKVGTNLVGSCKVN